MIRRIILIDKILIIIIRDSSVTSEVLVSESLVDSLNSRVSAFRHFGPFRSLETRDRETERCLLLVIVTFLSCF